MTSRRQVALFAALLALLPALRAAAQTPPPPPETPQAPATAGQVRGTITTARRTPAIGAIVVVRPEQAPAPVFVATTGSSGTFAFDAVPDGRYRAEVRREGFAPVMKSGIVVKAPFRAVVEVLLQAGRDAAGEAPAPAAGGASVDGRAARTTGEAIAEARVRLVRADGRDDPRSMLTGPDGGFAFPDLTAGRWRLEIRGAGLLPLRADLDLAGPMTVRASIAPQPADYKPTARDLIVPEEALPPPGP